MPPQDPFKQTYAAKQGAKVVTQKVQFNQHADDHAMLKEADVSFGFRHQMPWTQKVREVRCQGDDRTFDKIVARSVHHEEAEADRERRRKEYSAKPQRGTMRGRMIETSPGGL